MGQIFKGQAVIVTGGARGIGKALVKMFAQEGADVAFNYVRGREAAEALQREVAALGVRCLCAQVDIRDFTAVKAWIDGVKAALGRLDILVNNAGIIRDKALMLMAPEEWGEVIDTNLNGVFNATRSCLVTFLKQKQGQVITVSSVSGITGLPRQTNYSASKGGVNAFTKALAKEVAAYGVRVNAVAPGYIETDILSGLTEQQRALILQDVPLGRLGRPEEIAGCVRFLASEAAAYLTGQIILIDGGLAIR